MFTEKSVIDKIEVLEDGQIQVRRSDVVFKDGEEIARVYHRHVLAPGDDTSAEHPRVMKIAKTVWDAPTVAAFKAKQHDLIAKSATE